MKNISELKFSAGSKEEMLPGFEADFPYIASRAELDKYAGGFTPWHWHKAAELFYVKSGAVEYNTPRGKVVFPKGAGGFVNSNVLHMTRPVSRVEKNVQLLHIFDPAFIAGGQGSRIEKKYVLPVTAAVQIDIVPFFPGEPVHAEILKRINEAFELADNSAGYELRIREALSEIWMLLYELIRSRLDADTKADKNDERLKMMMIYVHEHYGDKISVSNLASEVYLSERECFRIFRDYLHTTPVEYIRSYRLQEACRMLVSSGASITDIGCLCGLGNSSYFGKIFRKYMGCTPKDYRRKWQDSTNKCLK